MKQAEYDARFWDIVVGYVARDERLLDVTRWMLSEATLYELPDVEKAYQEVAAEVADEYGLELNPDLMNEVLNTCDSLICDELNDKAA